MVDVAKRPAEISRTSEALGQLERWLEDDRGSTVLAHGRRGVGKQRLAEDLVRRARSLANVVILEGRAAEAGGKSFHPFAEIAHQAVAWAEQAGLAEALVDDVFDGLSPVLHRVERDGDRPSLDQKLRLFDALRRLLAAIGAQARLLVVVHDLERADSDTLELASYLTDELFGDPDLDPEGAAKGLLLLLLRDDVARRACEDFLAQMRARPGARCLHLEGLDLDGLRRYVQSPHVLEKLLAASDGLPQEVDALIEALPDNVEAIFERKLEGFDATTQDTLRALAICGRPAGPRGLAAVTGHELKEVARALNTLRDEKVVDRKIHNGELQFTFYRTRDLEVTERSMRAEDRARYHGAWAEALSNSGDPSDPALLAYHQLRSAQPDRGVTFALEAAETYAVSGALHAAVETLESARPHADGELLLGILERLTELAPLTGNPQLALDFVEQMKAALPEGQRGVAHLREAELRNAAGEYDLALAALQEARAGTDDDELLQKARIEAAASEAHYHRSERAEAAQAAELGLDMLSAVGGEAPTKERIELLNQLGKIALADDDPARAIELFQETQRFAERSGLASEQARALVNLGMVHMRRGESSRAEQYLLEGIEKARGVGDLTRLAFGYMNLGVLVHQLGELGRAVDCYRECRSLFRRLGNRTQLARVLHNLGSLYLLVGDVARARAHNAEALRLAKDSGVERLVAICTVVDGIVIGADGDQAAAEPRIREGMRLQRRLGQARPVEAMLELAELKLGGADPAGAAELLDEAEGAMVDVTSPLLAARHRLLRGQLSLELGEPRAVEHLTEARDAFERLGRQLFVRDAETALTVALVRAGRKEAARVHLEAAQRIQAEVAEDLPKALLEAFRAARPQQALAAAEAELEGRAPPEPPRPQPGRGPRARPVISQRRPEWHERYHAIVGRSPKLYRVFHILDRIAQSEGTVLINGESGTGKELVAEAIHNNSPRADGPFVKLNCAALVESLLLSELFGHERGSFTGAHQRKIGRFEMAAGGTLFLDEIGDISPKTQVSLLRVLQEREFERVGGGKAIPVEARIIFATNRNLQQMVAEGTFREDLYYRLKGLTIDLPPLRDRPEDIVALSEHFLVQYASESGTSAKRLSADAVELLTRYGWPGNIRELENITRSVALFAESQVVTARDFDEYRELFNDGPQLRSAPAASASAPAAPAAPEPAPAPVDVAPALPASPVQGTEHPEPAQSGQPGGTDDLLGAIFDQGIPLPELKKRIQTEAIARALRITRGNITRAAEMLGMRRPRLSQIINADEELKALCQGANR